MISVKGYAALLPKTPLTPYSFERRATGEHDVLIDIRYCGVCHSDIHQVRDEWGPGLFPMVPGHEIAGIVREVGSKVSKFKKGDHVGVGCFVDSCRHCENCLEHQEQYCLEGMTHTYNSKERNGGQITLGGYSSEIVVDENYVLRIPDNIPLDSAAPLFCAGITLYSPLRHWNASPGKKVAIIGLGGLGHMGVKLAHAMGAEVTVLSQSMKKEADSKRLGADHFYATSNPETFSKLANHFDLIINTVSSAINWGDYTQLLKTNGTMVILGIPPQDIPIAAIPLIASRRSIAGSLIGGIKETQEMLDFCGKHNISSDIELIPISHINEAYERVLKSDVRYRFVIDIKSLNDN
ncbi:putative oxidoreductase, Zn-dependent and NAD(P)-binding protein [Legionella birminghamensis]|uniref:Oxidoreductase, Zn-dependent and NAD(P)-binding n=1 Tax=Legionella birminghamensis TaxID=28083 RepID=A0A378I7H1_9GAMM|nr:NAD(P)-dependent alcohol dehydrogenase [Legionella birminghamensis]KTC73786.1 putative oxidoreductase, Zn-dependent and NAD(P)-binding protein [Legionella birminghamensis]STX30716.1 oxidoreductase, Zn-dependent and NAD(P)-binding [Legionella birminghamensis]